MTPSVTRGKAPKITRIDTLLSLKDRLGAWKVRWGFGRNRYRVEPGLYAAGSPGPGSPVLVTANYKLTFDTVRASIPGIDAWILVLDTGGINVWCAAGKGTFGTRELVRSIRAAGLDRIVTHRLLILPQLGAVGVAAHQVRKESGFRVIYGPVRSADIPDYLAAECNKTAEMKQVRFGLWERMVLVPMELTGAKMFYPAAAAAALLLDIAGHGRPTANFFLYAAILFGAVLAGAVATPILLPWLPFRAFALKGAAAGLLWAWLVSAIPGISALQGGGFTLIVTAVSSFLAMNFTGAATYTSQSGVAREVRFGLPAQASAAALGIVLMIAGLIREGLR